jgi:hypothetical protein
MRAQADGPLWVRVGGGLEEVGSGRRHGPADPDFPPPPGGPWEELRHNGRLVGWAPPGAPSRGAARRAVEEGVRLTRERRAYLVRRLGHKVRSSALALQESARQAAFGRQQLFEEIHDQAQDLGRRAFALEAVALDPVDPARAVVIGAVLNLAAPGAERTLPQDAVVRAPESVLVEALTGAYEWMGGPGTVIRGELVGKWGRLEFEASPERRPLAIPELGEPLIRYIVDTHLEGWLDTSVPNRADVYLPAV